MKYTWPGLQETQDLLDEAWSRVGEIMREQREIIRKLRSNPETDEEREDKD